jgi:glycosyltransferase involved in cell wall biosynthesis
VPREWPIRVVLPPDDFFWASTPRFIADLLPSVFKLLPLVRRADIVHAVKDYPHSHVGLLAAAHGSYAVLPLADPRHARRARVSYPKFGKIICVSEYTRSRISELLPLKNLAVVHNGVDVSRYGPRAPIKGKAWSDMQYTVAIGALKERKGHHLSIGAFLEVAHEFPELSHFVVGAFSTDDPYFEEIRERISKAGCEAHPVLHPHDLRFVLKAPRSSFFICPYCVSERT